MENFDCSPKGALLLSPTSWTNHNYYTKWVTIFRIIADLAT